MAKEDLEYQKWLEEIKSEYPEEVREAIDKIAAVDTTKDLLYRGTLRQKEFYTRLNKLAEDKRQIESEKEKLKTWYDEAEPEYKRMKAEYEKALQQKSELESRLKGLDLEDVLNMPTKNDIKNASSLAEVEEMRQQLAAAHQRLNAVDHALPALLSDMFAVTHKSISEKWDIDPAEVLKVSFEKNKRPMDAFEELISTQKRQREEEKLEQLKKEYMEKGRKDALSKIPSPDRLRPNGPTIVDALRNSTPGDPYSRVDKAVSEFLELGGGNLPV